MHNRLAVGVLLATLLAVALLTLTCKAQEPAMEDELQKLKDLHEQGLIPTKLYEERVRGILGRSTTRDPQPGKEAEPEPSPESLVSGLWHLRVEGLGMWAPNYTLDKTTALLHWKLSLTPNGLSVGEYSPSFDTSLPPGAKVREHPFAEVEIRDVVIEDHLIAFKVKGVYGAYESYRLEKFREDEIVGTYTVYDRYGGGPGSGPEYRGRLILERME